jgi:hypothetical protein
VIFYSAVVLLFVVLLLVVLLATPPLAEGCGAGVQPIANTDNKTSTQNRFTGFSLQVMTEVDENDIFNARPIRFRP